MARSIFIKKTILPTPEMVFATLDDGKPLWDDTVVHHFEYTYDNKTNVWKFYGKPWGWSLVFQSKNRTLMYLTPAIGFFYATFYG